MRITKVKSLLKFNESSNCRKLRDFKPLAFLLLCIASFASDTCNIVVFFNNQDVIFASLTLICLVVPGYFGILHLLKNEEFFQDHTITTRVKTTFLYLFCIILFPVFNISFRATKLFLHPRDSLDKFTLGIDQVKSLFEDSPQLALQLFICFITGAHTNQILAIVWSSLAVAVPNVRSLIHHEKSRMQSFKSKLIFYFIFVLISFTRAATIAFICCFLRYNAIIVYICTFLALKIVFDIAKLISKNGLAKMSQETQGDVIANAFNILDLTKNSLVIRAYALFWMIFNVVVLLKIHELISHKDPILQYLWIAPSLKLAVWSENFIVQQNFHQALLVSLCFFNMLSCIRGHDSIHDDMNMSAMIT